MKYRMKITELVPHSRLPEWCLRILSEVKFCWDGVQTPFPESAVSSIRASIGMMTFSERGVPLHGELINRKETLDGRGLRLLTRTGNTPLVEIKFEEVK